ncbi:filamentous hemagglutinin N-terminal domain-containing protein [Phormidium sp. CLA17]|uniref:two-partner secretion domain-containing protein n=1 Tax=Leptolyngbya sp. Cla-17 TaxID=2803751 RepID=UPI0014918D0B|nr:filamentous hemagglutinin N-terminal domain-containing protein [Leptolyngbya sp. Cla-17]MBM0743037.1 filamentous hemagglutinin N-terminal domain-containing protein [Leptolyngbya sp. Cla-17]
MAAIYSDRRGLLRSLATGVAIVGSFLVGQGSVFLREVCPAAAQNIVTDGTLGAPATAVPITPNGTLDNPNLPGLPTQYPNAYLIQEALGRMDLSGTNLFHSFSRFNLGSSESAVFQSGANIRNILARVTGGNASIIDGLIQTQSINVNLFLINPQGIVFGPNAALDVGGANGRGSFVATTTDALIWGNDPTRQFNARTPGGADSLLTLVGDPSGFLVAQTRPGAIAVNGSQLGVFADQRLLLLGGDVTMNGGRLLARGGRVEIASIAGAGTIGLNSSNSGFSFQLPSAVAQGEVLINDGIINTSARDTASGDISIQAKTITVTNGSRLFAETAGAGNAGDIYLIASDSIELNNQSTLQSIVRSGGVGEGGVVFLQAPGTVSILNGSGLFSVIDEGGSGKFGTNDFAGNVFDAVLGKAGKPIVGSVFIDAGSILLANGSVLNASTAGNGNAGAILAVAQDSITITNGSAIGSIVYDTANGSAGGVIIAANSILIDGSSALTTSTLGNGDAGLILAVASDLLTIDGNSSGIFSTVEPGVSNAAGGIVIGAKVLELVNGAKISVDNAGSGPAGDIFITGLGVYLDRSAQISAITNSGQGGNIELEVGVLILNNNSNISTEAGTAQAGGNGGNVFITGNTFTFGGNRAFIVSGKPIGNSNIRANAFTGDGGSISIRAYKLTDIARRADVTATNDIDASSRFGLSGTVDLSILDIDLDRGTVALTGRLTDVTNLIAEGCDSRGKLSLGRLISTGRGGLPNSPVETLTDETVAANWVVVPERNRANEQTSALQETVTETASRAGLAEPDLENSVDAPTSEDSPRAEQSTFTRPKPDLPVPQNRKSSFEIVEAQGWELDSDGNVVLVAQAKSTEPLIPWLLPGTCPTP